MNGMQTIRNFFSNRISSNAIETIEENNKLDNLAKKIVNLKEIENDTIDELEGKYYDYIKVNNIKFDKIEKIKFFKDNFDQAFNENFKLSIVKYIEFWKRVNNKNKKLNQNKKNITELNIIIPKFSLESLKLNIESCKDLKEPEIKIDQNLILKTDDKDDLMEKLNETFKNLKVKENNIIMNKNVGNIKIFKEKYNKEEDFKITTFNNNY